MKISIVVPAFNEQKMIHKSLSSMKHASKAFHDAGWKSELIVCDNNSTDETASMARESGATVVFEPINQIARARNRGASIATGDWLLFIDADSFPSYELFHDLAGHIASGHYLGGGAIVKMDSGPNLVRMIAGTWNLISRYKRWAAGSFVFCEKAAFDHLGGFSHELFAAEEIEFSKRLHKLARSKGRKLVILHKHPLVTSARKVHLYSTWDHLRFFGRTVLRAGRPLRKREECILWYDGKR